MLLLPTFCPTPPTICGLCGHGKTATTPRILLSESMVNGYDLGPTLWNYNTYLGWSVVIVYDPNTGIYTVPPWNPAAIGAPPMPEIPPIPVYDSRNQVIATISGSQNLSPTQPLDSSLTYFGGAPTTIPPGPPYTNIQGPGDWVGSVGESMGGWIDPQQISIPNDWWAWTTGKISDQVLHVQARRLQIDNENDIGVGSGGGWSYNPQWDYGGTWISTATWYFWPDDLNVSGHT